MQIEFSPVRADATLALTVARDVLTINGAAYDFGALAEGDTLPRAAVDCPALASDVTREGGTIRLTLTLPHGEDAGDEVRFPAPITAEVAITGPGLTEWDGEATTGLIDWAQVITAAAAEAEALAAWRASRVLSRLDLCLSLRRAGVLDDEGAVTAASGGIPAAFASVVAAMPPADQIEARVRWAALVEVPRLHPLIVAIGAAAGLSDAQMDGLFGWVA